MCLRCKSGFITCLYVHILYFYFFQLKESAERILEPVKMGKFQESVNVKTSTKGLVIALVYGICSASMAFANKAVLSTYSYNYPVFLVTVQMIVTIVILEILRGVSITNLPGYTLDRGRTFFFPSLFYALNSVLSLSALSGMNIPMYGMLKRCGPLVVLLLGILLLGKGVPSRHICLSVAAVTLGCILAGKKIMCDA